MATVKPTVVGNAYRWIACTTYCGLQWPSMGTYPDLLWWTVPIDRQYPQSFVPTTNHEYCWRVSISIVADNIYR